jgi:hypothetical protein
MPNSFVRFRAAISKKPLHTIAGLFITIIFCWVAINFHHAAFAGVHVKSKAQKLVEQAQIEWRYGNPKDADKMFAEAFQLYASAGNPTDDLSEICFSRAHINSSIGNVALAHQLEAQGNELKRAVYR